MNKIDRLSSKLAKLDAQKEVLEKEIAKTERELQEAMMEHANVNAPKVKPMF